MVWVEKIKICTAVNKEKKAQQYLLGTALYMRGKKGLTDVNVYIHAHMANEFLIRLIWNTDSFKCPGSDEGINLAGDSETVRTGNLLRMDINPATKYLNVCHSGEGRNPVKPWMPDQVRHDGVALFNCRFNIKGMDEKATKFEQTKESEALNVRQTYSTIKSQYAYLG